MPDKEENYEGELVTLVDEQGNEHDFMVEDIFEYRDKRYAVLVPSSEISEEDEEDDSEAYIFRIEQVEGEDVLVEVEDEEEWEQVASQWEILKRDPGLGFGEDEDEELN